MYFTANVCNSTKVHIKYKNQEVQLLAISRIDTIRDQSKPSEFDV